MKVELFLKFFLLSIGVSTFTFSQEVEVLRQVDIAGLPKVKNFIFIEPASDTSKFQFIATFKATAPNNTNSLYNLYKAIRRKAQKCGANSFKLVSFLRSDEENKTVLIFNTFYADSSARVLNFENHEKNVAYILCGEKEESMNSKVFKHNQIEKEIAPGYYYRIELEKHNDVSITSGGHFGDAIWLRWEKNKLNTFLTLSEWAAETQWKWVNYSSGNPYQTILGFSTGNIKSINNSFGYLLLQVLKKAN